MNHVDGFLGNVTENGTERGDKTGVRHGEQRHRGTAARGTAARGNSGTGNSGTGVQWHTVSQRLRFLTAEAPFAYFQAFCSREATHKGQLELAVGAWRKYRDLQARLPLTLHPDVDTLYECLEISLGLLLRHRE
ncbi:hypothetical protein ACOMHN_039193 [Nucella lapillus]